MTRWPDGVYVCDLQHSNELETNSMREVNVGIIGYGFMGKTHTFGYINLPMYFEAVPVKVKKLVMCTRSDKNVAAADATGYYDAVIRDWRTLIDDKSIDIIHICTPNNLHKDMLIAAIEAGKCIYCDKPITATYEQAKAIEEAIIRTGYDKTSQMCLNGRFMPATMRAKQLADEGFMGDVLSFRAVYLHNTNVDPQKVVNWKSDKAVCGGGVLIDLGSHILDMVTNLAGGVKRIWCRTDNFTPVRPDGHGGTVTIDADELGIMVVELTNGAVGTIETSKVATGMNDGLRFEIHGRDGAMKFDYMKPNWLGVYDGRDPDSPLGGNRGYKDIDCVRRYEPPAGKFPGPKVTIGWLEGHVHCLHNFLAAVAEGKQTEPSLGRGIQIAKWLNMAYRSAATGQWVDD